MEAKLVNKSNEFKEVITSLQKKGYKQAGISCTLEDWLSTS